jgi:hypothetical protein
VLGLGLPVLLHDDGGRAAGRGQIERAAGLGGRGARRGAGVAACGVPAAAGGQQQCGGQGGRHGDR